MILGAVLAGGQSSRFGSDKALAVLGGETLMARALDALSLWCKKVVVVGRATAPAPTLPDWPCAGMGPLGGIAAALHAARDEGFAGVLTCGVDLLGLPEGLPAILAPAPAYLVDQPVVGLWPIAAIEKIEAILRGPDRHSIKAFAEAIGARAVACGKSTTNINTPADLAQAEKHHGL